jgi:hypothetical protein
MLLLGLAAACAPTHVGGRPPSLGQVIDGQLGSVDAVTWSAARPLSWADFRGVPPTDPGEEGARTAYALFYGARCTGQRFEFRVIAAVRPNESWVTPAVLADPALSARSLRHEQTHFNLAEVHARRMRRYFRDLYQPCAKTGEELNALAERFLREERAAQVRYDDETNYGRQPARQEEWDAEARRQIQTLRAFEARDDLPPLPAK